MIEKAQKAPGKRGRPRLPPGEGKRYPLNMRTTKALRDQLVAASEESGRSLVQEVEARIEASFLVMHGVYDAFGGEKRYRTMMFLANQWNAIEEISGHQAKKDGMTTWLLRGAIDEFFKLYGPKEERAFSLGSLEVSPMVIPGREFMAASVERLRVKSRRKKISKASGGKKPAKRGS